MEATEVFSKITYLRDGMEKLLAQGPLVSSADIQALLDATEAKAKPTLNLDAEKVATFLVPRLVAKMPSLDAAAVAKQLGPVLVAELPTPATLRQAGDELMARLNKEYKRLDQQVQVFLAAVSARLDTMEQRMEQVTKQVPHTVGLNAFQDKKVLLLTLGIPAICLLTLLINSIFFRVSKSDYERLQADYQVMEDTSFYYYQQVRSYKQKFPKTASYFPDYHRTAPADSSSR